MEILIPDNWLKEFLKTHVGPEVIAECLSLCGPSIDRIEKIEGDPVYLIEVTTNRVDSASVLGIVREASAILPRFKIAAKLLQPKAKAKQKTVKSVFYLKASVDPKLCFRFSAILIRNVKIGQSPAEIQKKLIECGTRPINNIVDISNYIMLLFGQPVHTFDYDKIKGAKMILRASKRGERLTTLDGKNHKLSGEDIVIEDGSGRLIDLAGIMGGQNSMVDENTKNVLLFVQTYNPVNIRKTSMSLAARSEASMLFEKGLDTELVGPAMRYAIDMFVDLTKGTPAGEILDIYPNPYKVKAVKTNLEFINERLGISLTKDQISKSLASLGFYPRWSGKNISVEIPSYRRDVEIPEDIVEEVARIYGYHNLPNKMLTGELPEPLMGTPFDFEEKVKDYLSGWGGVETYTLSFVSKGEAKEGALKLKNPLGAESEYLRTSLMPSLQK
ncbi:phenylalanine--tRNA ligase subunit beta, partial [Patescibacteria group bacterium]|nr:phenylalanine--tRNA ligase subunit beta [Patescibacteria group bacterium]